MTRAPRCVLSAGFFDGVHLGHAKILSSMRRRAEALGCRAVAWTFRNHPLSVLAPSAAPGLLMPLEVRLREIATAGGCEVAADEFTPALAATAPGDAIDMLLGRFGAIECVFCGEGWRFGKDGAGNASTLRAAGIEVREVRAVEQGGARISSTRIRSAVREGRLEEAAAMLGRPFAVCGRVAAGKGAARAFGFPTVNIIPAEGTCLPPPGVYETRRGIANLGYAPTFGAEAWKTPVLEVHFFGDPPPAAPGDFASEELVSFVRPERKFESVEALRVAVERDIAALRKKRAVCAGNAVFGKIGNT